jgi:hypothetical protein
MVCESRYINMTVGRVLEGIEPDTVELHLVNIAMSCLLAAARRQAAKVSNIVDVITGRITL